MRRVTGALRLLAAFGLMSGTALAQTQGTRPSASAGAQPKVAARPPASANGTQATTPRAPAAPPAVPPKPDARMKPILAEWEQRSGRLKSLDVKISRMDIDPAWKEKEQYVGRAFLQSPNLACLDFKKVTPGPEGKNLLVDNERIVCTGTEVWQYKPETKQVFIFPLDKQDQKRALEEGPLPFLFNMRAADAEARYYMSVVKEEKEHFIISIIPKLQIDQESFSKAFLQLNKSTYLPDRILLVSPNGKASKDFRLSEVAPNARINPKNFEGFVPPKPWQVVRDPEGTGPARQQPRLGTQQPPTTAPVTPRRR